MIPKQNRKAGQLYAETLSSGQSNLVYCLSGDKEFAKVKILWPYTYNIKLSWKALRPVTDVYPSKHEIAKMIFGDVR